MAKIRPAEARDRAELEACFAQLQAFERSIEPNRIEPEAIAVRYIEELLEECAKHRGVVLVAESEAGDRIVGFTCVLADVRSNDLIEQHRGYAYVTDLFVRDEDRGSGLGRQLMQAAEAHALANGASRIRVGVLAANELAHGLYRKLGYRDYELVLEKVVGAEHTQQRQ